ncbi:MAG: tetratricopeptide repeat protein [Candidatus Methanoperedens sp.]
MIQAANEFLEILDNIYGVYLDGTEGFSLVRNKIIEGQKNTNKIIGMSIEDLDNAFFTYGKGDPRNSDSYNLHKCTQGKLKKRNEKDGDNDSIIANLCIVLIYQYWEDHYREQIAKELGHSNKNDLESDIMGDLRLLRISIIHHKAIAKKEVGKCKLLQWFEDGDKIYVNREMFEDIIFYIKADIKLINEDYINHGSILLLRKKFDLALKSFEKAIEIKPDSSEAWSNKCITLNNLGRYDEALKAAEKVMELKPDSSEAWSNKGITLNNLGRYDEALKAAKKAIEIKPDNINAWFNKCASLFYLGRYDEALKAAEKAIEIRPDNAEAWSNKGITLIKLNRHNEAIKTYENAIELNPDNASYWFNLACSYAIQKVREKTLSNLKRAIDLDKSFKEKAKEEKDFEKLWDDGDFKKLIL